MANTIDLSKCFPPGQEGRQEPLPKQSDFLWSVLDPKGPKYVAYIGGIGSGKSLILCITMLSQALKYPGDYLIGRQYMPELKMTTLKTFLEICPPELIHEHKVAENLVRIKAVGGISNMYFRQLEEPDKFRSLNLSGFGIDECNQVSEDAFLLLQGRLRGPGLRKGIVVSNPNGHDWVYRWFYKKDHFKTELAKSTYKLIRAPSTENVHLPDGYIESVMQSWSEDRIKREIMGSFDAFEGMVYEEFERNVHIIPGMAIPEHWPRFVGIDHGYRNPSAWVWCAVGEDGEVYVYREFYEKEWLINEVVGGNPLEKKVGAIQLMGTDEKITQAFIDPSTKARRGTTGTSDWDEYRRCLPDDFPLYPAKNDVQVGLDRVKSYLKVNTKTGKPNLYIFSCCKNLIEEITQYRYQELKPGQQDHRAENEKPVKVNDHALDALRYVVVTLPDPVERPKLDIVPYGTLSGNLQQELKHLHTPKKGGPFDSH